MIPTFVETHDGPVDLNDCELFAILQARGGKIIISKLPFFPVFNCNQEGCYEMAEYLSMLVANDGEDMISCQCEEHMKILTTLSDVKITH